MKYPEHIKEFWRLRASDGSMTNTDFALYSYLCNCLNSDFWTTDRVTQRRELICGLLSIGSSTLEESRNRLKQKGLIDFTTQTKVNKSNGKKQGVKGSATTYIVLNSELCDLNSVLSRTQNGLHSGSIPAQSETVFKYKKEIETLSERLAQLEAANAALVESLKNSEKQTKPKPAGFEPPTFEEVKTLFTETTGVNGAMSEDFANQFVGHYASKGWKVGKEKMQDWRAAVTRTWLGREDWKKRIADYKSLVKPGAGPRPSHRDLFN